MGARVNEGRRTRMSGTGTRGARGITQAAD